MSTTTKAFEGVSCRPYPKDAERRTRVRVELAKRDMTITDLARALGMNRGNLSSLINGSHISAKNETKIAEFFGMEREALFPRRTRSELARIRGLAA